MNKRPVPVDRNQPLAQLAKPHCSSTRTTMKGAHEKLVIPRLWCSARLNLAILSMLGCVCFYSLRVNVSFTVVCMVNHTAIAITGAKDADDIVTVTDWSDKNGNDTGDAVGVSVWYNGTTGREVRGSDVETEPGVNDGQCGGGKVNDSSAVAYQDGELAWNKEQQGLVLGSIFWGYMLTNIAGGIAATRYGGKRVIGGALAVAAVLTAVTPVASRSGVYAVMAVRFFIGMCLGTISPAFHALWAQWAPPLESSKLRSFCFAGCQMGYVLTFPFTALLCEYGFDGGWPSVFYVMACSVLAWCLVWMLLVTDSPLDHPRISQVEQTYIVTSLKGTISMNKKRHHSTPWLQVLMSRPVWATFIAHTCFNWGEYTFLTNIPTYLREVLLFDIKANGLLSALPYACFWFVINVSGQVADVIRRKQLMNTTKTRNFFNFLGSVVPACLLVGVGFLDCSHSVAAVALLSMGVAMTGCLYGAGLYINFSDLSPRHAGVLYGISNTIATVPGFVAPIVIGVITHDQSQESWRWVFFLASCIYIVGWVAFFLLGSGEIQAWAREDDPDDVVIDPENSTPLTEVDKVQELVVSNDVNMKNGSSGKKEEEDMCK
ncbi:putative transporter slc-17.2 [Babylonia areolata]|uniref:putative transporter slc-17.2 n=1 Tax=Babylonia areolata TaxID=304850 RepID=UPI003FD4DE5A